GAEPVSQVSAGNLENRVGENEGREDPAHLRLGEGQVARNEGSGLRYADPVDVGDYRQRNCEDDHPISDTCRGLKRNRGSHGTDIKSFCRTDCNSAINPVTARSETSTFLAKQGYPVWSLLRQ